MGEVDSQLQGRCPEAGSGAEAHTYPLELRGFGPAGTDPAINGHSTSGREKAGLSSDARAVIVNRTHRVVRARALQMKAHRSSARGLVVPLLICSALLLMMSYALWTVLAGGGSAMGELQEEAGKLLGGHSLDTAGPLSVLFFWFLPVSAVVVGTVLFRRSRGSDEVMR